MIRPASGQGAGPCNGPISAVSRRSRYTVRLDLTALAPEFRLIKPRTPPGVMELLPREQIAFQRMLDTIRRNFERFGFLPVETPVIELSEVLLTKSGGETERQVYFVQSTGALDKAPKAGEAMPELALRFDLTVPLARYVAEHEHDLAFPFRRYQMQRVYRGERAQRGRFREFYQCDIDVIGKDALSDPLRRRDPGGDPRGVLASWRSAPSPSSSTTASCCAASSKAWASPTASGRRWCCARSTSSTSAASDAVRDDAGGRGLRPVRRRGRPHHGVRRRCARPATPTRWRSSTRWATATTPFERRRGRTARSAANWLRALGVPESRLRAQLLDRARPGLLHRHRLRDHARRLPADRLDLLGRPLRQPRQPLHASRSCRASASRSA